MTTEREQILALAGEPVAFLTMHFESDCVEMDKKGAPYKNGWSAAFPVFTADQVIAARKDLEQEVERLNALQARYISEREEILIELNKEQESGTELRQQLTEKDAEIAQWKANSRENKLIAEHCNRDLASAQAQIVGYRDALKDFEWNKDEWHLIAAIKEIDATADTSALEAIVKQAGEVMRERCASYCERLAEYNEPDEKEWPDRIRALPGVTMEDLQK